MSAYAITEALAEHIPLLARIELAGASLFSEKDLPAHARTETLPLHRLTEGLAEGALWTALWEGAPVGYALMRQEEGTALLAQIDVLPEHGRRGLGKALVSRAAARAAELGYDALYLTTFAHIAWNAPFYAKQGFLVMPEDAAPPLMQRILRQEYEAGFANRVIMRLSLPRVRR